MLTIIIVVFQIRAIVPVIMDGLVWFVLPCLTVAWNDTMAYVCGLKWGRKWVSLDGITTRFIDKPLTPLSPNKSWEGFIGGGLCTIVIGWIMVYMMKVGTESECQLDSPSLLSLQPADVSRSLLLCLPLLRLPRVAGGGDPRARSDDSAHLHPRVLHGVVRLPGGALRRILRVGNQESIRKEGLHVAHSRTRWSDGPLRLPVPHALLHRRLL